MTTAVRHVNPLEDWPRIYTEVLKSLSKKHRDDHAEDIKKSQRVLKSLQLQAWKHKRGDIWTPEPDQQSGYYPVIENVDFEALKRAIRANTSESLRHKTWEAIKSEARKFIPRKVTESNLDRDQYISLLKNFAIGLPQVAGFKNPLLGKAVPGDIDLGSGSIPTVTPFKRLDPETWNKGFGFTMRRFSMKPMNIVKYDWKSAVREFGEREFKKLVDPYRAVRKERALLGTAHRMSRKQIRPIIEKISGSAEVAKNATISVKTKSAYNPFPVAAGSPFGLPLKPGLNVQPYPAVAAHEATHAWQHRKMGTPLITAMNSAPMLASVPAGVEQIRAIGQDPDKPSPALRHSAEITAGGWLPKLAMETHANINTLRYPGGLRAAAASEGSYLAGAALATGGTIMAPAVIRAIRRHRRRVREQQQKYSAADVAIPLIGAGIVAGGLTGSYIVGRRRARKGKGPSIPGFLFGGAPYLAGWALNADKKPVPKEKYALPGKKVATKALSFFTRHPHAKTAIKFVGGGLAASAGAIAAMKAGEARGRHRQSLTDRERVLATLLMTPGFSNIYTDAVERSQAARFRKPVTEYARYEQGLHYDLDDVKARVKGWYKGARRWVWGGPAQAAIRGGTHGLLGGVNQFVNLPLLTIDRVPLRRPSFDPHLAEYPNWQLSRLIQSLDEQRRLTRDQDEQKALAGKATQLKIEELLRNSV